MTHPNQDLVNRAYDAQLRGDLDSYIDLLADDFVMHIPGRPQIAGDYQGKAEMRRHFKEIAALSDGTFRTAVHDVLASDDHAVGLIEAVAQQDGVEVALPRVHVWHIRDGRLAELFLHPADPIAFDSYWG